MHHWIPDHRCFQAYESTIIAKGSCNLPVFCGHVVASQVQSDWFTKLMVCHTRVLVSSDHRCVRNKCTKDNARVDFKVLQWKNVTHRIHLQHGMVLEVASNPEMRVAQYWHGGKLHYTRPQCFRAQKEIPEMIGVDGAGS